MRISRTALAAAGVAALGVFSTAGVIAATVAFSGGEAEAQDMPPGHAVYEEYCGTCHNQPDVFNAPSLEAMKMMSPEVLRAALTTGKMSAQGAAVPRDEFETLISYLGAAAVDEDAWITANMCPVGERRVDLSGPKTLTYQGVTLENTRHMSAERAGLSGDDLANLEVAWVLAYPQTTTMRAAPVIVGDTLFYSSTNGYVQAIDTEAGCIKWSYKSADPLRSSIAFGRLGRGGPMGLVFTDLGVNVQALNAQTGELLWKVDGSVDDLTMLTGSPLVFEDKVIVPLSSTDVTRAGDANYECCQGRGAVIAFDGRTGERDWVAYSIEQKAEPTGLTNSAGARLWGPSGAIVWSSPAIDPRSRTVYAATGENTSLPSTNTSDALWSIDLDTGETNWFFQALENDAWNMACPRGPNCPDAEQSVRRDFDFGAGPVVVDTDRGRLIIGGQKSGDIWAVDEEGYRIWHNKFGQGSALGGVHWGIAANDDLVFAPIADGGAAGMYALDLETGQVAWQVRTNEGCPPGRGAGADQTSSIGISCRSAGLSAAPLSIDDAVVAATLFGEILVFDSGTGAITARYNTNQEFPTVNGVPGKGGSIDAQSIAAGDGKLFVGSGYPTFGQPAGNVLIAYRPKSR